MNRKLWIALILACAVGAFVVERAARAVFVTWGAGFELSPAHTDPVSQGDTRIRELKENVRTRTQVEMDFGDNTLGTANTDTGRMLLGSARPFFQNAAPTQILNADTTGSTALDDGRLWIDPDGPDGVGGTEDDYHLKVFDTSDGAFHDATVTPLTVYTILTASGSDSTQRASCFTAVAYKDVAANCGAAGLVAAVAIPATEDWIVRAHAQLTVKPNAAGVEVRAILQYNDGATTTYCDQEYADLNGGQENTFTFSCLIAAPTNAATYTFRLIGKGSGAVDVNPTVTIADPAAATTTHSFIDVVAEPKKTRH